uniref:Uncharacterized protein n=1 Tax=Siphoviridae sp. ctuOq1 TaxID=2825713 RepID=A0A8S5UZ64_9CAUD|nr:MAG TPA: hypothetical protein [Siphoviridae sp. ctuOq1]
MLPRPFSDAGLKFFCFYFRIHSLPFYLVLH